MSDVSRALSLGSSAVTDGLACSQVWTVAISSSCEDHPSACFSSDSTACARRRGSGAEPKVRTSLRLSATACCRSQTSWLSEGNATKGREQASRASPRSCAARAWRMGRNIQCTSTRPLSATGMRQLQTLDCGPRRDLARAGRRSSEPTCTAVTRLCGGPRHDGSWSLNRAPRQRGSGPRPAKRPTDSSA